MYCEYCETKEVPEERVDQWFDTCSDDCEHDYQIQKEEGDRMVLEQEMGYRRMVS